MNKLIHVSKWLFLHQTDLKNDINLLTTNVPII